MENPLSHLLLLLFIIAFLANQNSSQSLFWITFLAALTGLNRMDLLLILLPAVWVALLDYWGANKDAWKNIMLIQMAGWTPLIMWLVFSLIYFGFIFPNTAYAKLSTGFPRNILLDQGVGYFMKSPVKPTCFQRWDIRG